MRAIALLLYHLPLLIQAQSVYYRFADGTELDFPVQQVRKVTFQGGDQVLWLNDGVQYTWPLDTLQHYEFDKVLLDLHVLLEGAYVPAFGLMHDSLRTLGRIPLAEPYSALGYELEPTGSLDPAVLAISGPEAIVDWVVVELRDPNDPSRVKAAKAALLQRDGDVVATDGISPLRINRVVGAYTVSVRHRNHLGVMTAGPLALGRAAATVDLASPTSDVHGTDARKMDNGACLLWAGDVNGDGQIKYVGLGNDRDPALVAVGGTTPNNVLSTGYRREDVNMDGRVKYTGASNDRDPILVNIGGTQPTLVRQAQLPGMP